MEAHWRRAGIPRRLHVERFHAPWAPLPPEVTAGRVRFAKSGLEVTTDGRTNLLRVAAATSLNHGGRSAVRAGDVVIAGAGPTGLATGRQPAAPHG